MTRKKQYTIMTNLTNKVEWQEVEYDADCSDVEGLSAMPCPVAPGHQNYPINSVINDLTFSLEFCEQLRGNGELVPADIVKISRAMQTFLRELSAVLEVVSSRHTQAKSAKDPVTERQHTEKLVVPSAMAVENEQPNGGSVSGNKTRPKTVTFCVGPSSRRIGGTKIRNQKETVRSSDSAYGSSPGNRPKSAEASVVKHKARHKKHKSEPTELMEFEPAKRNKEMESEIKKVRRIFQGMLDGTLEEMNPQLLMMKKKVSDLLKINPDFSLMELVDESIEQLY
uniref:(northern house mosquito) hypothetical protein n=1 Tax=Culex pipiens TaxID=7175 RepID=A0A8D8K126_CULPI